MPGAQGPQQPQSSVSDASKELVATKLQSLALEAIRILQEPDAQLKAERTHKAASIWKQRQRFSSNGGCAHVPDRPGRDDSRVKVVAPGKVRPLGKGGSLASRQAILHSLVHIESWAVDLSWDAVARFGQDPLYSLPEAFMDDFVQIADDEASHFQQLQQRLEAIGSYYGALPVHDGLWESAEATAHSLPARLAVESCVHEARGLDRLPYTIQRFQSSGDLQSAALLKQIYQEEIAHCAAGVRWLTYLHKQAVAAHAAHQHFISQPLQGVKNLNGSTLQQSDADSNQQHHVQQATHQSPSGQAPSCQLCQSDMSHLKLEDKSNACDTDLSTYPNNHGSHLPGMKHQQAARSPGSDVQRAASGNAHHAQLHDWQADAAQYATVEEWFHALVRAHFKGSLKPPFNEEARKAAGFGPGWYLPLASEVLK